MRQFTLTLFLFVIIQFSFSQGFNNETAIDLNGRISTIDFVEILNNNVDETLYYYNNNWKSLRKEAVQKDYILSYQLLKAPVTSDSKIQLLLITTYANKEQYDKREAHFSELIKKRGGLKLLNEKKPNEFRKVLFSKEQVKHLH